VIKLTSVFILCLLCTLIKYLIISAIVSLVFNQFKYLDIWIMIKIYVLILRSKKSITHNIFTSYSSLFFWFIKYLWYTIT